MPPRNKSTSLRKKPAILPNSVKLWSPPLMTLSEVWKRQSRVLRVRKEPKKTQTYLPESLLPKQIRSPQHPFFRTFIPMPFSTNYSSQTHLKVTIDRAFWHRQPKLTSRERIRLIISGLRAGTWLFNESGIGLHGGREFIKDLYGNPRYRFRKINTRRNSQ